MTARVYLDVPYSQKEQAQALGARWDPRARKWFVTDSSSPAVQRWSALPELPDLLPGEDRQFGQGLFVDLVPSSCWFTNVRSCVSELDWQRLRRVVVERAGRRCEVCSAAAEPARKLWLEAHERWEYDELARVQRLRRIICLCTDCHTATHVGFADIRGLGEGARAHLGAVMGWSRRQVDEHVEAAFVVWGERSRAEWELDLGILTDVGVTVMRPPTASERATRGARGR